MMSIAVSPAFIPHDLPTFEETPAFRSPALAFLTEVVDPRLLSALVKSFHSGIINGSIQHLIKQSEITPPSDKAPKPFDDRDIDTIHFRAYDFAAMTYNVMTSLAITSVALGILGFLSFNGTVLSFAFFCILSGFPEESLEATLKSNQKGVVSIFEQAATPGFSRITTQGEADDDTAVHTFEAAADATVDEALPLFLKKWMRLTEMLPPGVELSGEYAEWAPNFDVWGFPIFKNPTVRLDLMWEMWWNHDQYDGSFVPAKSMDEYNKDALQDWACSVPVHAEDPLGQ
jgi:hypothetical protein